MADTATTTTVTNDGGQQKVITSYDNTTQDLIKKRLVQKDSNGDVVKSWNILQKGTKNLATTDLTNTKKVTTTLSSFSRTNKDGGAVTQSTNQIGDWYASGTTSTPKDQWTKNDAGVVVNTSDDDYENARAAKRNQLKKEKEEAQFKSDVASMQKELPMDIKELRDIVYSLLDFTGLTIESVDADKTADEIIAEYKSNIIKAQNTLYNYIADIIASNKETTNESYNIAGYNGIIKEEFSEKFNIFNEELQQPLDIVQVNDSLGNPTNQYMLSNDSAVLLWDKLQEIKPYILEKLLTYKNSKDELMPIIKPEETNNENQIDDKHLDYAGDPGNPQTNVYTFSPDDVITTFNNILAYMKEVVKLNNLSTVKTSSSTDPGTGGTDPGTGGTDPGGGSTDVDTQAIAEIISNALKPIQDNIKSLSDKIDNIVSSNNLVEYNAATFIELYKSLDQLLIYAVRNYVTKYNIDINTFYESKLKYLKTDSDKVTFRFVLTDGTDVIDRLKLTPEELAEPHYTDASENQTLYFNDNYLDSIVRTFDKETTSVAKPIMSTSWNLYIKQLKDYLLDLINSETISIYEMNNQRLTLCKFIGEIFNMVDFNTSTYTENPFILDDENTETQEKFIELLNSVGIIATKEDETATIDVLLKVDESDPTYDPNDESTHYTTENKTFFKYNVKYDYINTDAPYNNLHNEYYLTMIYNMLNTMLDRTTTAAQNLPEIKMKDENKEIPNPKWIRYWWCEPGETQKTEHLTYPEDPSIIDIDTVVNFYTIPEWINKLKNDWLSDNIVQTVRDNPYYV